MLDVKRSPGVGICPSARPRCPAAGRSTARCELGEFQAVKFQARPMTQSHLPQKYCKTRTWHGGNHEEGGPDIVPPDMSTQAWGPAVIELRTPEIQA